MWSHNMNIRQQFTFDSYREFNEAGSLQRFCGEFEFNKIRTKKFCGRRKIFWMRIIESIDKCGQKDDKS